MVVPHFHHTRPLWHEIQAILAALVGGAQYGVKIRLPHALVMTWLFRRDLSSQQKLRQIVRLTLEHATHLAAFATIYKTVLVLLKLLERSRQSTIRYNNSSNNNKIGQSSPSSARSVDGMLLLPIMRSLAKLVHGFSFDSNKTTTNNSHDSLSLSSSLPGHPERMYHAFIAGAIGGYLVWGRYSSVNYQIVLYLTSRVLVALIKRFALQPQQPTTTTANRNSNQSYRWAATLVWGLVMILFEENPNVLHPSLKQSMNEIYRYRFLCHDGDHETRLTT